MLSSITFEFFQVGQSIIHRLDPRVKLLGTIGLILSNVLLPDGAWLAFTLSWIVIFIFTRIAHLNYRFVFKRAFLVIPFVLVAFTVMFTLPGESLVDFRLFSWNLTITVPGLLRFVSIVIRSWLSIQAAILLTATTKFPDMAHGLRHLYIPLVLIAIISFMYRYLFVLREEAERLMQARAARSAALVGKNRPSLWWRAKNAGNMVGQLFLRSYERSDRVYNAMVARGFQGEFLTFTPHHMHAKDWAALAIMLLILVGIQFSGQVHIL